MHIFVLEFVLENEHHSNYIGAFISQRHIFDALQIAELVMVLRGVY